VQPEPEVEEDPEEVQQEDPVEQPQLYDATVLEVDADGDIVIPPTPEAAEDAPPAPVAPAPNAIGGDPNDSGDDSGEDNEDNNNGDENPEEEEDDDPRYRGAETTSTPLKMRMASYVSYCRRYCNTWGTL
jgi:hypothetical protein